MYQKSFLNNVCEGKNNWWRYLTVFISLPLITIIITLLFLFIINFNFDIINQISNQLFTFILLIISSTISFLVFYILIRLIHHKKLISFINTYSKINWIKITKGAILWLLILCMFNTLSLILYPTMYKQSFDLNTFGSLLILSLIAFIIRASFEEIFFRGYLMQGMKLISKKPIVALLVTSALFGIFHFFNTNNINISICLVLDSFIFGIMVGIITLGENRIETVIGVHISNNVFTTAIISTPNAGFGNLPSIFTAQLNPYIGLSMTIMTSLTLIVILFWNRKDALYNIFQIEQKDIINKN